MLVGHPDVVTSLAVLEGGRLASGSSPGPDHHRTIKIWEVATGACVATLVGDRGGNGGMHCLAVLEGGRLASGCRDQNIQIWDSALSDVLR